LSKDRVKMPTLLQNKKVHLRFEILETFQAGLSLSGGETKSLRAKLGSLEGSRIVVRGGEAYLVGATIPPYQPSNISSSRIGSSSYDPEKPRKLLLNKKELHEIAEAETRKGLTVVPIEMYSAGRYIKVRIGVVRGKGKADKREDLKKKDAERDIARAMKR
jgi:SsrA-binding protein